jgi:2-dehydro-3-deoxygluconokinase
LIPDVISIGEPMVEFCATNLGRLSQVELYKRGWGGDSSNFAVSVARQGSKVAHICRLGDDEFGRSFLELWEKEGMDSSRVKVEPNAFTAVYFISLMENGGHDFTYYRKNSAASRYGVNDLDEDYIKKAKVVHTSGISMAVSETLREAAFKAMDFCKEANGIVSFDLNLRPKLWSLNSARSVCDLAFKKSNIVFASKEDIKLLFGITEPSKAGKYLIKQGVETVIIKLGSDGCYVRTKEESFTSTGYKINVIDTTGAGDAFDGAWIVGQLKGWDNRKKACYANAVGALTSTGLGAVDPIPTRKEALKLINKR